MPPPRRARLALRVLLLLSLLVGLPLAARQLVLQQAHAALTAHGLSWSRHQAGLTDAAWHDLRRPGLHIQRLEAHLLPAPRITAQGISLQLDQLSSAAAPAAPPRALPLPPATVSGVTIWWGETLLAEGLQGTLWPTLALSGPDATLSRSAAGALSAQLRRALEVGPLRAEVLLTVTGDAESLQLTAEAPTAVLSHPRLAQGPLPPAALRVQATWSRGSGALSGSATFGGLQATFSGSAALSPTPRVEVVVEAPSWSLEEVVARFGAQVPEGRRADMRGHITLSGTLQGPPWAWSATVDADDLAVEGVVSGLDRLRYGPLEWMAPSADGPVMRRSGDDHADWTSLAEGRLVAQAAIAAEDARFLSHPGYDVEGINIAFTELAAGEEHPRGGSTLTQQLAKNLFLDGSDRTLARKLRELLIALELERALGKNRILELYINIVELGPGIYGVRRAADTYFLKRPANLSPHEAAFLAAILPAPRTWYERVYQRNTAPESVVDRILANMVHTGALDAQTAQWAAQERLVFIPPL